MIEQVARALYYFEPKSNPPHGAILLWDAAASRAKDEFRAIARAAISGMREPTEEMVNAQFSEPSENLIRDYKAMIDAALKED